MFVSVIFDIFTRDFGESRGFSAFDAIAFFSGRKTLLVVATGIAFTKRLPIRSFSDYSIVCGRFMNENAQQESPAGVSG